MEKLKNERGIYIINTLKKLLLFQAEYKNLEDGVQVEISKVKAKDFKLEIKSKVLYISLTNVTLKEVYFYDVPEGGAFYVVKSKIRKILILNSFFRIPAHDIGGSLVSLSKVNRLNIVGSEVVLELWGKTPPKDIWIEDSAASISTVNREEEFPEDDEE